MGFLHDVSDVLLDRGQGEPQRPRDLLIRPALRQTTDDRLFPRCQGDAFCCQWRRQGRSLPDSLQEEDRPEAIGCRLLSDRERADEQRLAFDFYQTFQLEFLVIFRTRTLGEALKDLPADVSQ